MSEIERELIVSEQLRSKMDDYGKTHIAIAERDGTLHAFSGHALCRINTTPQGEQAIRDLLGNKAGDHYNGLIYVRNLDLHEFNDLAELSEVYEIKWNRERNYTH